MPAERLELETALGHFTRVLFDTCVLIDEFKQPSGRLRSINLGQRATSVVAIWEFLHIKRGALLPEAECRDRRIWLGEPEIPIVTSNVRDFQDIGGLRYVAW